MRHYLLFCTDCWYFCLRLLLLSVFASVLPMWRNEVDVGPRHVCGPCRPTCESMRIRPMIMTVLKASDVIGTLQHTAPPTHYSLMHIIGRTKIHAVV